jgi:hypothetical protein
MGRDLDSERDVARESVVLNLAQNGAEVAGSIEMGNFSGPVTGTLAGNPLTFTSPGSRIDGTLTVKENRMSGTSLGRWERGIGVTCN